MVAALILAAVATATPTPTPTPALPWDRSLYGAHQPIILKMIEERTGTPTPAGPPPDTSLGSRFKLRRDGPEPIAITQDTLASPQGRTVCTTKEEYGTAFLPPWFRFERELKATLDLLGTAGDGSGGVNSVSWHRAMEDHLMAMYAVSDQLALIVPPKEFASWHSEYLSFTKELEEATRLLAGTSIDRSTWNFGAARNALERALQHRKASTEEFHRLFPQVSDRPGAKPNA